MAGGKNWISGAIKHPGALTRTASSEGKTLTELCAGSVSGRTARRCALRNTLRGMKKKKK